MKDKDENDNEIKTSNSGGVRRRNKNFGVSRHQLILYYFEIRINFSIWSLTLQSIWLVKIYTN